ncbi:acyl-CoA dehydrogenase [Dactylosporangium fulvum]|uniref:Acyl-CoA dehydrogenase family protein n=1 Tax=Dactylosporangium fulvum TaxID=53359 RepID=A0ABY5WB70_9ACTN|nr:acyl-CoA dehydrogenase family protein [Dactylosporangium fulvum]UWP85316.1 acyl-CoA dehydrogenase family protein [Dactylosporangium fulvum]
MFLEYTDEQTRLRRELRAYFAQLLTPEVREAIGGTNEDRPAYREVVRQMGRDGWLGLGWPTEYGGQGRPAVDQYILFDEVQRAGAPFPFVTINNIGPTIQRFGTDEQKRRYLPGMLTGDILFAIGYTEPESGTDLASLKTRAVLAGDEWVINGTKVFTSGASQSDYIWLACRTDPDAPRHRGISVVIVSTSDPGFSCTPIATSGPTHTNVTYYSDVRAPRENLVGELHGGWKLITSQLGHERVGLAAFGGRTEQLWEDVADWCRQDQGGGRPVDQPWVRHDLARTYVEIEAMRLLNWKLAVLDEAQSPEPASAAVAKVFGTETHDRVCRTLLGAVGPLATRRPGSVGAPLDGRLEALTRGSYINTFGGGTNEVLRDVIATRGLGMPRKGR